MPRTKEGKFQKANRKEVCQEAEQASWHKHSSGSLPSTDFRNEYICTAQHYLACTMIVRKYV